jgi:hypothetical protein
MVRAARFTVKGPSGTVFTSNTHDDIQESELAQLPNSADGKKTHAWAPHILSASVRQLGILVPVIYLRAELLDGTRRLRLATDLEIECPRVIITSETHAARILWRAHPARAWERFVRRGMRRAQIADLFGVELSELPDRRARWLRS